MIRSYKRSVVWLSRNVHGRLPIVGKFYQRSADRYEKNFWREWTKWMGFTAVVYVVAHVIERKMLEQSNPDNTFNYDVGPDLRQQLDDIFANITSR